MKLHKLNLYFTPLFKCTIGQLESLEHTDLACPTHEESDL